MKKTALVDDNFKIKLSSSFLHKDDLSLTKKCCLSQTMHHDQKRLKIFFFFCSHATIKKWIILRKGENPQKMRTKILHQLKLPESLIDKLYQMLMDRGALKEHLIYFFLYE